jgi:methyl-accepting chemotaxis protein
MPLLHKISLTHKFLILGLIAAVTVAIPTALYFKRATSVVKASELEMQGTGSLVALNKVIQLTQIHRGISAGMLNGNDALAVRRPAIRDAVIKAISATDTELTKAKVSSATQASWSKLRQNWLALEPKVADKGIKAVESTNLHTQLISEQLLLSEQLIDEFGLSLDPDLDTYNLMRATFVNVPWLAENLGAMRALGSSFLTQRALPPDGRATLVSLKKRVLELKSELFRNLDKAIGANSVMKTSLQNRATAVSAAVDGALEMADKALLSSTDFNTPATEYFDFYTRTIDGLFDFNDLATTNFIAAIQTRIDGEYQAIYSVIMLLIGCFATAASVAFVFVRSIVGPVNQAVVIARSVADGHLHAHVQGHGSNELGQLLRSLSDMNDSLTQVVSSVRLGSEGVATASAEIAQGNNDLSGRTESQASALQETAASMEQLGSAVRQNADSARQANQLALSASAIAVHGGEVMGRVVETMKGINDSSRRISDIISVIDGIAFQTNILALNAAVEAARAGDQGRGFAVVASEVRSLAGRSAAAAKEITTLINASVHRVEQGTALVDQAGATMTEVVGAIKRVTDIVGEISAATEEQSLGVAQVGEAVNQMDQTTQQNAALVEEMAAAASSLSSQAQELVQTVNVFTLASER